LEQAQCSVLSWDLPQRVRSCPSFTFEIFCWSQLESSSSPALVPHAFSKNPKPHRARDRQVTMTTTERQQAADSWPQSLAPYLERRTGPRKVAMSAVATRNRCTEESKMRLAVAFSEAKKRRAAVNPSIHPAPRSPMRAVIGW